MTTLVFSYSHVDELLRNELETHLTGLKRQGLIDTWHDRRIKAGQEFANQIDQHFENADIVLLLVSPDFIASDYCYNIEMTKSLARHESKEAIVIPVILRPCDWHELPFGKLMAATKDGKPIVHFPTHDDGFLEVVKSIKNALKRTPSTNVKSGLNNYSIESRLFPSQIIEENIERSSNLRIRKTFSDREKDKARIQAYEYISGYFENSLNELAARNTDVECEFRRIDANSFEAAIYVQGKRKSRCGIWTADGRGGDIFFSSSGVSHNTYNECMTLSDDGYALGFRPMGMAFRGHTNQLLSNEGAAEVFWEMLIQPLQH